MVMDNLSINPLYAILPFVIVGMPVMSWIVLYFRGAEARDLLFWGAIAVVIPVLGPVAAIVFALRLQLCKTKRGRAVRLRRWD